MHRQALRNHSITSSSKGGTMGYQPIIINSIARSNAARTVSRKIFGQIQGVNLPFYHVGCCHVVPYHAQSQ